MTEYVGIISLDSGNILVTSNKIAYFRGSRIRLELGVTQGLGTRSPAKLAVSGGELFPRIPLERAVNAILARPCFSEKRVLVERIRMGRFL